MIVWILASMGLGIVLDLSPDELAGGWLKGQLEDTQRRLSAYLSRPTVVGFTVE